MSAIFQQRGGELSQSHKLTIPGSNPPSATPNRARTAAKLAKLRTKPRHMVIMPQTAVSAGSHIFGDAFLMIRLLGTSLLAEQVSRQGHLVKLLQKHAPQDIEEIVDGQADVVLMICNFEVFFEAEDFCVTDVGPVEEREEEE